MRISLIQVAADDEEPVGDRVERVAGLVRQQAGADLIVLPELWPQGGFAFDRWTAEAESSHGPTVAAMADAARSVGAYLHAGSFVERGPGGQMFNHSVVFGPDGGILATYRKIHLFGFAGGEVELLSPGTEVVAFPSPFGTIGLATCYDLRFPELFRLLIDAGAELILVPAAWPARRVEHWRLLIRARAVECQAYVLACNTAGTNGGVPLGGHSGVVDPWGDLRAEGGVEEEIVSLDIDPALVAKTRVDFPVLRDRRLGVPTPARRKSMINQN